MATRKSSNSSGSFTPTDEESAGEPNENKNAGGDALAGSPAQENDDSTQCYHAERHKFTEQSRADERVPSAGWREVYFSMGVDVR